MGKAAFEYFASQLLFKLARTIHDYSCLFIAIRLSAVSYNLFLLGHTLLERYGMTEIGMALSNPLHGSRLPVRHDDCSAASSGVSLNIFSKGPATCFAGKRNVCELNFFTQKVLH